MPRSTSNDIRRFDGRATDTDLEDLRTRLAATRFPEAETVRGAPRDPSDGTKACPSRTS
ncbi:hypothetical protein GCM10025883_24130 [Mobilicoccus caccae]|uniref:Uncharacterized protein n=1 Tax=Mobilicoccus caccae TaxID=1859295 RepID=A0ABQ6IUK4_9MICO|nr:hypothetical protein GCM10025883_24130 [Mobilicoccus caccae]